MESGNWKQQSTFLDISQMEEEEGDRGKTKKERKLEKHKQTRGKPSEATSHCFLNGLDGNQWRTQRMKL